MSTQIPIPITRQTLSALIRSEFLLPSRPSQFRAYSSISRFQYLKPPSPRRHASSSSSNTTSNSKPIVLDQPDKFRPPSHPQRLPRSPRSSSSSQTNLYGASYNQTSTSSELSSQRHKRYPHTFPNKGTFMHWFLTNKAIHLWIAMGTLTLLASISITQTFMHTSPYAHLFPSLSSLPAHPISYISEAMSVLRLHMEYTTEKTAESRRQKILDAQKRRLYRRAHGMEDLNAEEEQGIDVRGLVPWDDGLTNKERERGGRDERVVTGRMVMEAGGQVGDDLDEFAKNRRLRRKEEQEGLQGKIIGDGEEMGVELEKEKDIKPEQRKRKLWLGIW